MGCPTKISLPFQNRSLLYLSSALHLPLDSRKQGTGRTPAQLLDSFIHLPFAYTSPKSMASPNFEVSFASCQS